MGIKELLAERDGDFISLRALIQQLGAEEHVSIQDAATFLLRCIEDADESERPLWHHKSRIAGVEIATSGEQIRARRALLHLATEGKFELGLAEMDDDVPF